MQTVTPLQLSELNTLNQQGLITIGKLSALLDQEYNALSERNVETIQQTVQQKRTFCGSWKPTADPGMNCLINWVFLQTNRDWKLFPAHCRQSLALNFLNTGSRWKHCF